MRLSSSSFIPVFIGGALRASAYATSVLIFVGGVSLVRAVTAEGAAPALTLVTYVHNTHGGTAAATDWLLSATGPTPISGKGGATSGATFQPGTYALAESGGPGGYAAGAWTCEGGTQNGKTITVASNQTATCAITNTDLPPSLTLVNRVSNTNGGMAVAAEWRLVAAGPATMSGQGEVASGATFRAGTYVLSQTGGRSGYAASAWSCEGGRLNGNSIALAIGQRATCTIMTSDLAATLIVRKVVVNTSGGTGVADHFSFQVNGGGAVAFAIGGANTMTVSTGTYTVTEPEAAGYTASYNNCSKLVILNGATGTCTITNHDNTPAGAISQAGTTCAMFAAGLPPSVLVNSIFYGTDSAGRIASGVSPAAFVSYSRVTINSASTVTVSQKSNATSPNSPMFEPQAGEAILYTSSCTTTSYAPRIDAGIVTFADVASGSYVVAVKYSARSISGEMVPAPADSAYTFYANVNGAPVAHNSNGLVLKKQ